MKNQTVTTVKKFPEKSISIIVPFGVGSSQDLVARILEKVAWKHLGQSLIPINKPGGTGTIAWNELTSANPDGYTIGISSAELFVQPLYNSARYNYTTALEPLIQITTTPFVIAVKANHSWETLTDLISYAKQHPGELKFGHGGVGSIPHIVGETFAKTANITMTPVPFQSGAEALTSLLGDHVQVIVTNPAVLKEHVKSGKIKVLAVTSEQPLIDPFFSNVPTFKEQGLDIVYSNRLGIAIPKEMPIDIKKKLAEGLQAMVADPEFKTSIENIGLQYEYLGPRESELYWLADSQKLTNDVQETGILEVIKTQKQ